MASLYKKPVILNDPKTDKPVKTKSRKWWGRFKDEHGVERRVPLAVDKAAAQSMLNELVRKTERRAAGLIDRFDEHRQRPVADHIRDFRKHLQSRQVGESQVKLVVYRAEQSIEVQRSMTHAAREWRRDHCHCIRQHRFAEFAAYGQQVMAECALTMRAKLMSRLRSTQHQRTTHLRLVRRYRLLLRSSLHHAHVDPRLDGDW